MQKINEAAEKRETILRAIYLNKGPKDGRLDSLEALDACLEKEIANLEISASPIKDGK